MKPKFIQVTIIEGFSKKIIKLINLDHIIQIEQSNNDCYLFLSCGKVLFAQGVFERLSQELI